MFSSLSTKLALKKIGISSETFNFPSPFASAPEPAQPSFFSSPKPSKQTAAADPKLLLRDNPLAQDQDQTSSAWPAWMSAKSLSLKLQPWVAPQPPPVPVAATLPAINGRAPVDRDRQLSRYMGRGKPVVVVFLRCAGCAFAQKTFLNFRTLANKHAASATFIAVSHATRPATDKWLNLLGGAWTVNIIIDEDRAIYAAWGLGLSSVWSMLNPATQRQAWREKGWLGDQVTTSIQRTATATATLAHNVNDSDSDSDNGLAVNPMGNKWQTAGAFAVDASGYVVWAAKAASADDILDLDGAVNSLRLR